MKEIRDARATQLDLEIQKLLDEAMMKIRTCELNMDFIEKEEEETDEDYKSFYFSDKILENLSQK